MARRVFFSFNYDEDVWRVNQVRNCWLTHPHRESAGYFDASLWEEAKKNDASIRRLIDNGLQGTTVTAILVGANTAHRTYIDYEIEQSYKRGNGIVAVYINGLKDRYGRISLKGTNPLDVWTLGGQKFSQFYPTYDWVLNSGYSNCGTWFEEAAKRAGR